MTPSEKQLLRRIRDKIDSVEIGYEAAYELQLFLLNIAFEDDPAATDEPTAWTPKVGDEVVLTDGMTDDHYRVTRVHGRRCKLEWDGTIQDGWFDLDSLAPVAPSEPTDTEMLNWLASREFSLDHEKGRWFVCGMGYGLPSDPDLRSALRAAMKKGQ